MTSDKRIDGRLFDQTRTISIQRGFTSAAGSVLISSGKTRALCTASVVEEVPAWMKREGSEAPTRGWLTAEYRMLPGSTQTRKPRQDRPDGRATEIQRLIGRSLRAVFDAEALGPRTVYLDCDILQADGGTRTLCVSGACVALIDALVAIPKSESLSAARFRFRSERRSRRRTPDARPVLRGGLCGGGRHERRHDARRTVRGDSGNGRREHVRRGSACRASPTRQEGNARDRRASARRARRRLAVRGVTR